MDTTPPSEGGSARSIRAGSTRASPDRNQDDEGPQIQITNKNFGITPT